PMIAALPARPDDVIALETAIDQMSAIVHETRYVADPPDGWAVSQSVIACCPVVTDAPMFTAEYDVCGSSFLNVLAQVVTRLLIAPRPATVGPTRVTFFGSQCLFFT